MSQSAIDFFENVDGMNIYSFLSFDSLKTYAKINCLNKYECSNPSNDKLIDVDGSASSSSSSSNDNDTSLTNAKASKIYNTRSKFSKTANKTQDVNNETSSNNSNSSQGWLISQFGNEDDYLKRLDDNLANEDIGSTSIDDNDEEVEQEDEVDEEEKNDNEKSGTYYLKTRSRSMKNANKNQLMIWQPTLSKNSLKNSKNKTEKRSLSSSGSSRSSTSSSQSNNSLKDLPECGKEHCRLGCICEALSLDLSTGSNNKKSANISNLATSRGSSNKNIFSNSNVHDDNLVYRDHCGRYECMFECTCTRRLRSTTRLMQQTSQSSEGSHRNRNRNSECKSDSKNKHKKSSKNAFKLTQNKTKSKSLIKKEITKRSCSTSSSASSTNSNNQTRSSSVSSNRSSSESISTSLSSSNSNLNDQNEDYGVNKLRKSKRVKHLIKKAEEKHTNKKKSNKFEDDYYYYYSNNNQTSKSKTKINNKKSNEDYNNKPKKAKTKDDSKEENEEKNKSPRIKAEEVEQQQNHNVNSGFIQKVNKSKCKLDKILNKLNKNNALKNLDRDVRSLIKYASSKNAYEAKKEIDNQSYSSNPSPSTLTSFKPYTQSIILKIQLNSMLTNQMQSKSIPLTIEVFTSKWQKNTHIVGKVMKLIARLLQQLESLNGSKEENNWKELEFDYENELTVKMFASHKISSKVLNNSTNNEDKSDIEMERIKPTVVRIMKFKREEKKENANQNKTLDRIDQTFYKSISDLISNSSSNLVAFVSNDSATTQNYNSLNRNEFNFCETKTNFSINETFKIIKSSNRNNDNLILNHRSPNQESLFLTNSHIKVKPRILCTNRRKQNELNIYKTNLLPKNVYNLKQNSGSRSSNTVLNKTGLILKQVDSLFEKIKTSPSLDQTTASLLASILPFKPKRSDANKQNKDSFEKISSALLDFRPTKIKYDSKNTLLKNENLYDDEIKHYNEQNAKTKQLEFDYEFYDAFKDKSLITDLYKTQNSRDIVDSVCNVVNDMINAVCVFNKNKTSDLKSNTQTSTLQTPPAIKKLTILPNLANINTKNPLQQANKPDSELKFSLVSLNKPTSSSSNLITPLTSKPIIIINNNKNLANEITPKKTEQKTSLITSAISPIKPIKIITSTTDQSSMLAKPNDIKYKTLIKILPNERGTGPNITLKNQMVKVSSNFISNAHTAMNNTSTQQTSPSTTSTTSSSVTPRIINTNSTFTRPLILKSLSSISKNSLENSKNDIDDFDNEAFKAEVSTPIKISNSKIITNQIGQTSSGLTSFVPIRPKLDQVSSASSLHQQQVVRLEMKKIIKYPELDKSNEAKATNETENSLNEEQLDNRKRKRKQDLTKVNFKTDINRQKSNEEIKDKSKIVLKCFDNSKQSTSLSSPLKISTSLFKSKTSKETNDLNRNDDDDDDDDDETNDSYLFNYCDEETDNEIDEEDEYLPKTSKFKAKAQKMEIILDDTNAIKDSSLPGIRLKKTLSQKEAKSDLKSNNERNGDDDDTNDNIFDYLEDEENDDNASDVDYYEQYDENDGCTSRQGIYKCDTTNNNNDNNSNSKKISNKNFKFTNRHNSNSSTSSLNSSFNKNIMNNKFEKNKKCSNSYNINRNRNDSWSNVSLISLSSSEGDCLDDDALDMELMVSSSSNQYNNNNNKPTSNSLHSIKERERRFKLKKMFDALKIVSYKLMHPINQIDSLTDRAQIVELNNSNSTLRIKSKQRTLMEAVKNIVLLERAHDTLKLEFEREMKRNTELNEQLNYLNEVSK